MSSPCPEDDARTAAAALLAVATLLAAGGCEREQRRFSEPVPASTALAQTTLSELQPGTLTPDRWADSPYAYNAYAISQGKRLYTWFNCQGCHAQGGGGIGPPLMDDQWIYGGQARNVFESIVEGRPNGMPSFRGRIPDQQVWQLVAYVHSLSGQIPGDAAPGRSDDLSGRRPESMKPPEEPKASSLPSASQGTSP